MFTRFVECFHAEARSGCFGGIDKRWQAQSRPGTTHSKGAQSRFASLRSTSAKRLPNLRKHLHHPTARMQLLDSVYLGLPNVDIVRHRMQKAKTNLISFSLTNPLGMLSILSSTCDSRFLWFPASHFRGTRGASSQPQPRDRQLDGRATEDPSPIRHIRCPVALPHYSSLPWREEHLNRPMGNGHMVTKI